MRTLNLIVLLISIAFFLGITKLSDTYAQEKKSVDITAQKVEKSRGDNPNIEFPVPKTDDNPLPKPEKERGDYCYIDFENWTGYYVEIYVNRIYRGTLEPWDKGSVTVYAGFTSIYCITSGGSYEWSEAGSCDFYYTYKMYVP